MTETAAAPLPRRRQTWLHRAMRPVIALILKSFFKIYGRWRVLGTENIPKTGAVIFAANHASYLDPTLGWASVYSHREMWGIAKEELFKPGLPDFFMRCLSSVPVKRGAGDRAMFRVALEILGEGKTLGMFPEGTRTADGNLNVAQPGLALLALKSGAPVIPVALIGTYAMWPRSRKSLKRADLTVVIGKPIAFDAKTPRDEIGPRVMQEIAALMTFGGQPTSPPEAKQATPVSD